MIMEIKRLLVKIYLDGKKIIIQWIPAHVGIIGNELADMLAKEAMEIEEITELDLLFEEYILMINPILHRIQISLQNTGWVNVTQHNYIWLKNTIYMS